jgi:hypothetical protein
MSNQTIYNFWRRFLETGETGARSVPKIVSKSSQFQAFFNGQADGAIISDKRGKGQTLRINENKRDSIEQFFYITFPNSIENITSKAESVAMYRNSKASGKRDKPIFFIKGFNEIKLNEEYFDLETPTNRFGLSAFIAPKIEYAKICFVENKDVFLDAEKLFGEDYLYVHKYGRIGKDDVKLFTTNEILVFSDYDYVGLNEYLTIKGEFENTKFYVPNNYDDLHSKYSMSIKDKQTPSELVLQSTDESVVRIRTIIQKENTFLEQQSLLINY